MRLSVHEITGDNAITRDVGLCLYDRIHPALLAGDKVELDFSGVRVFASPFFNTAVGLLYKDLTSQQLRERLRVQGLTQAGRTTLAVVTESARKLYGSEEARESVRAALEDELAPGA